MESTLIMTNSVQMDRNSASAAEKMSTNASLKILKKIKGKETIISRDCDGVEFSEKPERVSSFYKLSLI